jgi:hypothetical protein
MRASSAKRFCRRSLHLLIFAAVVVIGSESQNRPAQAEQDSATRRIERLEDQATAFTAVDADLKAIVAQQKEMLNQLIAANARQDERIEQNSDTLQKIATAADTIKATQEQFAGRITWVGGVLTTAIIVAGFLLDRLREKRLRNGGNPLAQPIADLEQKMTVGREETNKLLRELIELQSRRRTRSG